MEIEVIVFLNDLQFGNIASICDLSVSLHAFLIVDE